MYDLNIIKLQLEFEKLVDKRIEEWRKNGQPSGEELAALLEISDSEDDEDKSY